jgi:hypothetical protein
MTVFVYTALVTWFSVTTGEQVRMRTKQYVSMAECVKERDVLNGAGIVKHERVLMQCFEHKINLPAAIQCGTAERTK